MTQSDLKVTLHELVDKIECPPELPLLREQGDMSIRDALAKLRAAAGPRVYVAIRPPGVNWHDEKDAPSLSEWELYDSGKGKHYKAKRLDQAVAIFLAAYEPAQTVESLEKSLDGQLAEATA